MTRGKALWGGRHLRPRVATVDARTQEALNATVRIFVPKDFSWSFATVNARIQEATQVPETGASKLALWGFMHMRRLVQTSELLVISPGNIREGRHEAARRMRERRREDRKYPGCN